MSLLTPSGSAQSYQAAFSSKNEAEAFTRLFQAAYEGERSKREFKSPTSYDAMLGGLTLDNGSDDDSKVFFAVL